MRTLLLSGIASVESLLWFPGEPAWTQVALGSCVSVHWIACVYSLCF
jgi:hypothetical protein